MLNMIAGKHALKFTRHDVAVTAGGIFVMELAFQYPGENFQAAMRMPGKTAVRCDARHVGSQHAAQAPQRAPAADGEVRRQPVNGLNRRKRVSTIMLKRLQLNKSWLDLCVVHPSFPLAVKR